MWWWVGHTFAALSPFRPHRRSLRVKYRAIALTESFNSFIHGTPMAWGHLAVAAGWSVAGTLLALRFFCRTPAGEHRTECPSFTAWTTWVCGG